MRVLVTGGCGFIGSHLVEELVKRGDKVIVLDNLTTGFPKNLNHIQEDKFVCYVGDICWENQFPNDIEYNFDVVYHLAAKRSVPESFKHPYLFFKTNINGTYNMLEKNKGTRFVNISSSSAEYCLSPYGITKGTAERLADLFPNTVSLRLFNVFGERQADCGAIVPEFTKLMLKDKQPIIYGNGKQTRDFTYVKDVIDHMIKFGQGEKKECHGIWDVGYGQTRSVNEMFNELRYLTKFKGKVKYVEERKGDIRFSEVKNKIYNPKYGFEKGLKRTVKWIKENPYEEK